MPPRLLTLLGVTIITVAIWGLLRGKIIAGARGLRSNYYYKHDNPFSFYGFVLIYLSLGAFILYQSLY
ncbi:MAG TPA: hypothetical protein GX719_09240 [Gammaproteobacteria bacterium]|nr:hypothetical protein [Gammaproteobacteria bacterium]